MKKELDPKIVIVIVVLVLALAGGLIYMNTRPDGGARPPAGTATKIMGGRVVPMGPASGPPAANKSASGAE